MKDFYLLLLSYNFQAHSTLETTTKIIDISWFSQFVYTSEGTLCSNEVKSYNVDVTIHKIYSPAILMIVEGNLKCSMMNLGSI